MMAVVLSSMLVAMQPATSADMQAGPRRAAELSEQYARCWALYDHYAAYAASLGWRDELEVYGRLLRGARTTALYFSALSGSTNHVMVSRFYEIEYGELRRTTNFDANSGKVAFCQGLRPLQEEVVRAVEAAAG